MPTVPYNPIPSVQPSGQATPGVSVSTPGAAFGTTVAAGLEGLGTSVSHAGDELFKRAMALQELQNETSAKEADAQYMIQVGKLHADYSSLQGQQAVSAYPKYTEDIQKLRQDIRQGLPNDMARKMYDGSSLSTMGRTIFNGAGHAATQGKVAANGAIDARMDASLNTILANPTDDVTFKRLTNGLAADVASKGDLHGWTPEQTADQTARAVSKAWAHRITGLSKTEPFKAEELLQENSGKLHFDDRERVDNTVRTQLRNTGARMIANQRDPSTSLQEQIDAGVVEAKKTAPNDDLLPDFVRDRITSDFNKEKAVQRDFDFTNKNVIEGALMGGPDGKMPTTIEELTADPKASAAYDALNPTQQRHYLKQLASNAKGDSAWTPEGLRKYQQLKGMAATDPAEFMSQDVISERIPNSARRELVNLQQRLKNNIEGDPRVNRALQFLRPTLLGPAGIDKSTDKDGYNRFVGALQDALDQFQQDAKKTPDYKQVQEIGARLLQEQADPNKWNFGFMNRKTPLVELTVPEDVVEKIKADPTWAERGITPTDEQIQRIYVRKRYQELYSGKDKPTKSSDRLP